MDIRYRITNNSGSIIFDNLFIKDEALIDGLKSKSIKLSNGRIRCGVISNNTHKVYGFSSAKDYLKSSQKFKTKLDLILDSSNYIDEIIHSTTTTINRNTSRLVHNLMTLNAHNIQEVYSIIPQDKLTKNMSSNISLIEENINNEPRETAIALLRIAKNNAAMKVEFSVFKKLFENNPVLQKKTHNLHKVLLNVFYLFFPDFTDKNVKVIVGNDDQIHSAFFDYESLHVALYHLIENAAKYVKPSSKFHVSFKDCGIKTEIIMDMISFEIKDEEISTIFQEGVSGNLATRTHMSGSGIGLSRAKEIIELNSGGVTVTTHPKTIESYMGIPYQRNIFTLNLPQYSMDENLCNIVN